MPMIRWLRDVGMTPDMAYGLALVSIVLSLLLWFVPRGNGEKERPERLAIFVGLWPPTLALIGHALQDQKKR
jgi:hypothetical protein